MPTYTKYVNAFDSTSTQWDTSGVSPYLGDNNDYVYTGVRLEVESWFAFAASGDPGTSTINSVKLYVETQQAASGNSQITFSMKATGVAEFNAGTITPLNTGYSWQNMDVSASLNTWTKIDSAQLELNSVRVGGTMYTVYCRRAYLYVDYTAGGTNYSRKIVEVASFVDRRTRSLSRTFQRTLKEPLRYIDKLGRAPAKTYSRALKDPFQYTDVLSRSPARTYSRTFTETLQFLDTLTRTQYSEQALNYTLTLIEALAYADVLNRAPAQTWSKRFIEPIEYIDKISKSAATTHQKNFTEPLSLADALMNQTAMQYSRTLIEAAVITDYLLRYAQLTHILRFVEAMPFVDQVARIYTAIIEEEETPAVIHVTYKTRGAIP